MREQFEQAKREFREAWRVILYHNPSALSNPNCKRKFTKDLTALLEQHKEVICSQCHEQHRSFTYPGRPDPKDVNPYDIRSVHRARNTRKRT